MGRNDDQAASLSICATPCVMALYGGTTGIQANDLVDPKILRDQGAALRELLTVAGQLADDEHLLALAFSLTEQIVAVDRSLAAILLPAGEAGRAQAVAVS